MYPVPARIKDNPRHLTSLAILLSLHVFFAGCSGGGTDGARQSPHALPAGTPVAESAGTSERQTATAPMLSSEHFICGVWGKRSCLQWEWEDVEGGIGICDRGLDCEGNFFQCQSGNGVCRNSDDWPQRWTQFARDVRDSWEGGAFVQQRELARFEPLSWSTILTGHNAFNNTADGYLFPNQRYSMTDQLRMGARALMLDVHDEYSVLFGHHARLSHELPSYLDRHFGFGIIEIKQWLDKNPDQVVILQIENVLDDHSETEAEYKWIMERYLGDKMLFRVDDVNRADEKVWPIHGRRWPTLEEMRLWGKQVIVTDGKMTDLPYIYSDITKSPTPKSFYPDTCNLGDRVLFQGEQGRLLGIEEERLPLINEDLSLRGGIIAESCDGVGTVWYAPDVGIGTLACVSVREAVSCGNTAIILDYIGVSSPRGVPDPQPTGDRFSDLVWSWQRGVRGWEEDNRAALLEFDAATNSFPGWVARDYSEQHHFACGYARIGDPGDWEFDGDVLTQETTWKVTHSVGTYSQGAWRCSEEFGAKYVFNVPVNAVQNRQLENQLREVMPAPGFDGSSTGVWLSYRDVNPEVGPDNVFWNRENFEPPCVSGGEASPNILWPVNHKLVPVSIGVIHECESTPQCEVLDVSSNESSFSSEDFVIHHDGDLGLSLRAERDGNSESGRMYTVRVACVIDEQESRFSVGITVPHDRGK